MTDIAPVPHSKWLAEIAVALDVIRPTPVDKAVVFIHPTRWVEIEPYVRIDEETVEVRTSEHVEADKVYVTKQSAIDLEAPITEPVKLGDDFELRVCTRHDLLEPCVMCMAYWYFAKPAQNILDITPS